MNPKIAVLVLAAKHDYGAKGEMVLRTPETSQYVQVESARKTDNTQHPSERISLSELARRYDLTTEEMRRRLVECGMTVGGDKDPIDVEAAAAALAERDRRTTEEVVERLLGDVPEDGAAQALNDVMQTLRTNHFGSRDSDVLKRRFEQMSRSCRLELDAKMPCSLRWLLLARTRARNVDEQAVIDLEIAGEFDRWHANLTAALTAQKDPAPVQDVTQAAAASEIPSDPVGAVMIESVEEGNDVQ